MTINDGADLAELFDIAERHTGALREETVLKMGTPISFTILPIRPTMRNPQLEDSHGFLPPKKSVGNGGNCISYVICIVYYTKLSYKIP